ncbi:alpha/beta hydrolase-fold protein [Flavobacteriaceae bacterium]|jgi:predicted peptidase|nr:alpha/beta hydrolase-fold protein [Flavobacteriaceae bacterium]
MKFLSLFCLLLYVGFINAQAYEKRVYINQNDTLPYRVLLPENYSSKKLYPLLVFLHGAGERGTDNEKQLLHGSNLYTSEIFRKNYPAIVVFPQCPKNSYWASVHKSSSKKLEKRFKFKKTLKTFRTQELLELFLYDFEKSYAIDPSKRYLGGLSMGGMGTFELVTRMPNYFAAAFAICGGGNPAWSKTLGKTPFWIFHGDKDNVVSYRFSKRMYRKMKRFNKDTKFTSYKGVNHESWNNAFQETQLFPWVFSFIRSM